MFPSTERVGTNICSIIWQVWGLTIYPTALGRGEKKLYNVHIVHCWGLEWPFWTNFFAKCIFYGHDRAYRSPKTFSIGLSPKLVNPLDFHQLRWHFVRKNRWITLKITTLGETNSDKIVTCIVTKRGDHTITLIVTNSGRSPKKSPYGVKQKVTKLSHEFSPNTVIIPSP